MSGVEHLPRDVRDSSPRDRVEDQVGGKDGQLSVNERWGRGRRSRRPYISSVEPEAQVSEKLGRLRIVMY